MLEMLRVRPRLSRTSCGLAAGALRAESPEPERPLASRGGGVAARRRYRPLDAPIVESEAGAHATGLRP